MAEAPELSGSRSRFDRPLVYLLAVLLPLLVGGGSCAYLVWTKPGPSGKPQQDPGPLVRVFRAEKASHRVAITAYGTTRASEQWTAISEVRGRAVKVNPRFEPGEILPAGEPLVSIDPTDYGLAVKRFEAETRVKTLESAELDQTEKNLKRVLQLQQQQRAVARAEYERQRQAFEKKAISQSVFEAAYSAFETALIAVTQTENSLALTVVQRKRMQAALDAATVHLEQAQRDLSKCEIQVPFAARCASKSVEVNQYVAAGEPLGAFLALQATEVVAMVETRKMPLLFPEGLQSMEKIDLTRFDFEEFRRQLRIPVEVSWGLGDRRLVWYGRVTRIASSLDSSTQTIPVIVEVADPYKDVRPGVRPPLVPDVFCKVTAYGATLRDVVVIPRDALRDDRVYILRDNPPKDASADVKASEGGVAAIAEGGPPIHRGRLHIASVEVVALEDGSAVIQAGIEEGDLVVLADLFPATEGMPLRGELETNPARSRNRIDVPESVFDSDGKPAAAADEPAGVSPALGPPAAEPAPEANP